jgi:DNA-binding beta-propeller fold protein YncE
VDTGFNRVDSWAWTSNASITAMNITGHCDGLFIDSNNTLYCSISSLNQVLKLSLNNSTKTAQVIAGNLSSGSNINMLNNPRGIFVDLNFNLYVADCGNNRVQLFQLGEFNATTVAGNDTTENLPLNCPTAVVLDADNNLFIVDNGNHRIIEVTPNNSRCIVGCSGNGSTSSQLSHPTTLSFDSYGNIFVTDQDNNRIQKFNLVTNSCGKCMNNLF